MSKIAIGIATIAICAGPLLASVARTEPVRAALIVGNATYTSLPGIPACARSANTIAAALRTLGFDVTLRQDASTGGIDAGISEFAQHLAAGKGAGLIYVCGYAMDFNDRIFLLPTTANIARPSDVMTQGVLAKTMLTTVSRDPEAVAVVIFDLVPKPNAPSRLNLDALTGLPVPDGVGVMAASEATLPDAPTPVATALVAALTGPLVHTEVLLESVRTRLASGGVTLGAPHMPVRSGILAGTVPPPHAPPAASPAASPGPAVPPQASPAPAAVTPPTAATPRERLPDEAQMTELDRRKVQSALVRLGYYAHPIDAQFGPETRAAIRRYQHELAAEMTGHLTADQATRLVDTR